MTTNRIDQKFRELKKQGCKAFIPYVTAGYPNLSVTEKLVLEFAQNDADIIEIGIPFSDPMADGPTIQQSSQQALDEGVTLNGIFDLVKKVRARNDVPLALMTYYNPVFHFGEEKFVKKARACGVDGLIIPDLPPEEARSLLKIARREKISLIFFLAPTTTEARMKKILKYAGGFVYFVSVAGVTGARRSLPAGLAAKVKKAKSFSRVPVCVGFGISTPEQARTLAAGADGVIVGSAIIKVITQNQGKKDLVQKAGRLVARLSKSLHI